MKRLRTVLLVVHSALFFAVFFVYTTNHGGVDGDYVYIPHNDVVTSRADYGEVLFNRWRFNLSEETWTVQAFFYLNVLAFACGVYITALLLTVVGHFNVSFPFGLSIYTHVFLVALPLTFVQWYCVGKLAERLVTKRKSRGQAATS